ncbi:MAG: hypothetical protein ACRDY1_10510 [Acidimicrobiales bacterium]
MHFNSKFVKLGMAAAAPILLISTVTLGSGAASAKGKKPPSDTISCSNLTATITFSPPLVPTTSSPGYSKTDTTTISNEVVNGCTESPTAGNVTAATSASATVPKGKKGNTCSGFAAAAAKSKFSFVTEWNNNGGTSTAKFKGATVVTSPSPGFSLSKGKVKGAYPTKDATVNAYMSSGSVAAFAACEGGSGDITTLTISSGNLTA